MPGLGEFLALLAGFCYAAASVAVAKSSASRGGDHGALLSILVTAAAALALWLAGMALQGPSASPYPAAGLFWFGLSGLLTIVLGRALFFGSIARLGAIRASAINRLSPFFSVLLAAGILGETISPTAGVGMLFIGLSFLILVKDLLSRDRAAAPPALSGSSRLTWTAYALGPGSALAYALGYIARKFGLLEIPDSNFGAFVGAAAGLAGYLAIAPFSRSYRAALGNLRSGTTRWHVQAAAFISAGQLAQFGAIKYIEVSRVAMISSTEIFISIFLSVYVLKTERWPDTLTLAATVIAFVGVVLITLG